MWQICCHDCSAHMVGRRINIGEMDRITSLNVAKFGLTAEHVWSWGFTREAVRNVQCCLDIP